MDILNALIVLANFVFVPFASDSFVPFANEEFVPFARGICAVTYFVFVVPLRH